MAIFDLKHQDFTQRGGYETTSRINRRMKLSAIWLGKLKSSIDKVGNQKVGLGRKNKGALEKGKRFGALELFCFVF